MRNLEGEAEAGTRKSTNHRLSQLACFCVAQNHMPKRSSTQSGWALLHQSLVKRMLTGPSDEGSSSVEVPSAQGVLVVSS